MFLFRTVQGLAGSVNRLVLGAFAPVAALGEYAGAERISRVFQQAMWPVNQALYPKLTQQALKDPGQAHKTVRLSVLFLGALGLVLGAEDRHLDVRISILKRTVAGRWRYVLTSWVKTHNALGRAYMIPVGRIHPLIVKQAMRGVVV